MSSLAFVCDGVEQCLNGRDEADCCNNYCDDGATCIQDDSICDGYDDCPGDRFEYQEGCGEALP